MNRSEELSKTETEIESVSIRRGKLMMQLAKETAQTEDKQDKQLIQTLRAELAELNILRKKLYAGEKSAAPAEKPQSFKASQTKMSDRSDDR